MLKKFWHSLQRKHHIVKLITGHPGFNIPENDAVMNECKVICTTVSGEASPRKTTSAGTATRNGRRGKRSWRAETAKRRVAEAPGGAEDERADAATSNWRTTTTGSGWKIRLVPYTVLPYKRAEFQERLRKIAEENEARKFAEFTSTAVPFTDLTTSRIRYRLRPSQVCFMDFLSGT